MKVINFFKAQRLLLTGELCVDTKVYFHDPIMHSQKVAEKKERAQPYIPPQYAD
jgi:hypothetical protein